MFACLAGAPSGVTQVLSEELVGAGALLAAVRVLHAQHWALWRVRIRRHA
jgi:hypothetical protein